MVATTSAQGTDFAARAARLRAIDVDLHPQITDWGRIAPYAPAGQRHRMTRKGGPPLAKHGFKQVGVPFGTAPRPTGADGKPGAPAADPRRVQEGYLDARGSIWRSSPPT